MDKVNRTYLGKPIVEAARAEKLSNGFASVGRFFINKPIYTVRAGRDLNQSRRLHPRGDEGAADPGHAKLADVPVENLIYDDRDLWLGHRVN